MNFGDVLHIFKGLCDILGIITCLGIRILRVRSDYRKNVKIDNTLVTSLVLRVSIDGTDT